MHELAAAIVGTVLGQCPSYTVQTVTGPDCGIFGTENVDAFGISPAGNLICGGSTTCNGADFAIVWQPGNPISPVSFPVQTTYSRAYDVNQNGMVVGEVDASSQAERRGFRSQNGTTVFLQPLPGDVMCSALAVNSAGWAVGSSTGFSTLRAALWQNNVATDMSLPVGTQGTANDINELNQICGWMGGAPFPPFQADPFIWHNGKTIKLPLPNYAVAMTGMATAINNLGDACGHFFIDDPNSEGYLRRACAWIDGNFIELGILPGQQRNMAFDINDAREIVGVCDTIGMFLQPFVWRGGVMMDLSDLVPPGGLDPVIARAISNAGQIVGDGNMAVPEPHGVAFRLTPALPQTPGDTNCSASVDLDDLLNVIVNWNPLGPVGGNPSDLNLDNRINISDLLEVILHWTG